MKNFGKKITSNLFKELFFKFLVVKKIIFDFLKFSRVENFFLYFFKFWTRNFFLINFFNFFLSKFLFLLSFSIRSTMPSCDDPSMINNRSTTKMKPTFHSFDFIFNQKTRHVWKFTRVLNFFPSNNFPATFHWIYFS